MADKVTIENVSGYMVDRTFFLDRRDAELHANRLNAASALQKFGRIESEDDLREFLLLANLHFDLHEYLDDLFSGSGGKS
jgi:hypothetical protein